jgi:hypothetical protein
LFVVVLTLLTGVVSAVLNPFAYDPSTGREYDPFGGFWDSYGPYGQYVDPWGNVFDQYGEFCPGGYLPACDTYKDSRGRVYGPGPLSGNMKAGAWHFANFETFRFFWPTVVTLSYNDRCELEGSFTNAYGVSIPITITQQRRYVGTDATAVVENLREMRYPTTQERIYGENVPIEFAQVLLDEGVVDSNGYITEIAGVFENPDPSSCSLWYAAFQGWAFEEGRRFIASYQRCAKCTINRNGNIYGPDGLGELDTIGYCNIFHYPDEGVSRIEPAPFELIERNLAGDWLGDGQDIEDPPMPVASDRPPQGNNPFGNYEGP